MPIQSAVPRPGPVVCVYNLARFPGSMVLDVLRTHPMIILKGVLMTNALYAPPEVFLRELRERDDARSTGKR